MERKSASSVPKISRLCDTPNCFKGAVKYIIRKGKAMYVCSEHEQAPKEFKQQELWK